ncbi:BZ3500_MvSof-1268-A1-R1_Chr4-1g06713 [Microbotryum saponariae]|uniref:BZ3500_MvSof-1268-A1-R1_Chr4-1g06713 protein n=1 Tax=Microbotryum saponariae TaxID=289078 RepID=A0A2X0MR14_9BASI|nr:BZ3500_MvSof-1268-A1-R1_Chr4-1g06713 [Microbotryum saponariae]SDA06378.1 BZ3501_MvSof-1269-A2-R1_Chr4-1g06423 [Microbotryum saponariae]
MIRTVPFTTLASSTCATTRPFTTRSCTRPVQAARSDPSPPHAVAARSRAPHGTHDADNYASKLARGEAYMRDNGYDMASLVEQPVWGDCDTFQHLNNAMYIRYYETGRIRLMQTLLADLGPGAEGPLLKAKPGGVGNILGSISARFRRPVNFPDTLLVGHRVTKIEKDRYSLDHVCWSFQQTTAANLGECVMVCYDYGNLKKSLKLP